MVREGIEGNQAYVAVATDHVEHDPLLLDMPEKSTAAAIRLIENRLFPELDTRSIGPVTCP